MNTEKHYICRSRYKAEYVDRARELLKEYVEQARQEPGCLYYELHEETGHPGVFYMWDGWVNQEAVDAHLKHPNLSIGSGELPKMIEEGPILTELSNISKGE